MYSTNMEYEFIFIINHLKIVDFKIKVLLGLAL
jgi:hypothetical protein